MQPGKEVHVRVDASKDSCVCVALVDKSVHLLKPGYFLGIDKVQDFYCLIVDSYKKSYIWNMFYNVYSSWIFIISYIHIALFAFLDF